MIYGYGIVDKDGVPWIAEMWNIKDYYQMEKQLAIVNASERTETASRAPYSAVELTFRVKNGKFI